MLNFENSFVLAPPTELNSFLIDIVPQSNFKYLFFFVLDIVDFDRLIFSDISANFIGLRLLKPLRKNSFCNVYIAIPILASVSSLYLRDSMNHFACL